MAPYTSGNRVDWFPPALLATWVVTITQGSERPEDSDENGEPMTKPERNWVNVENAITVTCSECGKSTWKPLESWPPGWGVDGGLLYCNLHLPIPDPS